VIIALALCVIASPATAWGQQRPQGVTEDAPQGERPPLEAPPILTGPAPLSSYPLELLGLLGPKRGGVTFTPSIFVSEEYNDNINGDNRDRRWDFITTVGPALTLVVNRPTYQLSAGYSSSSKIYARNEEFNEAFGAHNFVFTSLFQVTPSLTLTASDSFTFEREGTVGGFSTGRQDTASNRFDLGMSWRFSPSNTLSLGGSYNLVRFQGSGGGADSDEYTFRAGLGHTFTSRFDGFIHYKFDFLDVRGQDDSMTHTPTVGFSYRLTPTLFSSVEGGPAITQLSNETFVTPVGSAGLTKIFTFGSMGINYTRDVSVAGGFGGPTVTQIFSGNASVTTLARGLVVVLSPAYTTAESVSSSQANQVDAHSFTVTLGAAYQFSAYAMIFGGYSYFLQHTGSSSSRRIDVNQNIVRVGLQLGYPFHFD